MGFVDRRRLILCLVGVVVGLVAAAATGVFLAGAATVPNASGAAHRCAFSSVDNWPVQGVSAQNVSCGKAHRLLDRFAKTNTGLRCVVISEGTNTPEMRCTLRLPAAAHPGAQLHYVKAVIFIRALPECAEGDGCGT